MDVQIESAADMGLMDWALRQVFPGAVGGVSAWGGVLVGHFGEGVLEQKARAAMEGCGLLPVEVAADVITATTTTACDYAVLSGGATVDSGVVASENGAAVIELVATGTYTIRLVQRAAPYRSGEIEVTV